MKTIFTRSLALLLTLVMLLTMLPVSALGEEMTENDVEDVIETVLEMTDDEMAEAIVNEEAPFTGEVVPPIEETTDSDNETNLLTEEEESPELPSDDPDNDGSMQEDEPNETEFSSVEDSEDESFPDETDEETVSPTDAPHESEEEPAAESQEEPAYSSLEEEVDALYDGSFIKYAIYNFGHAYITTKSSETKVYETSALENSEVICTIAEKGSILLGFEYAERWDNRSVLVWFLNDAYEAFSGYVAESDLEKYTMEDADAAAWMNVLPSAYLSTTDGQFPVFAVPFLVPASEEEVPVTEPVTQEETEEPVVEQEVLEEPVEDDPVTSDTQDEEPEEVDPYEPEVTIGTFLSVTTDTRVFSDMDGTVSEDNNGDLYMGVFVKDAIVQVASIRVDHSDRQWYEVAYLYGDDFADGTMKWVEIGTAYVLPEETTLTEADDFTVTDIALPFAPKSSGKRMMLKAAGASAMNGFTLKSINGAIPPLYAGQTGVYGSSGRDSDYRQIASVSGHGVVYATPHYLDGYTVYCLEHNLPGPGEGSGSSQQPKGPYVIVDIDTYMNTPGNSKVIYSTQTMHAIAWVLRHTYPFMVLDRSDSDNETWSRVAGQFAIRQVIRELEGAQYVRDYWNMDNFYVASGQAPAVYLEYARWLASNGIARGRITGYISMANKSISKVGSNYVGTVTLYTDADLIRIAKSTGSVTGNTGGSDYNYYYLNSGDTITVTSSTNGFSLVAESVNSDAEEASFLVGVPSAAIQKVLIPQYGAPYAMQSLSMWFEQEIQYGSLTVTKLRSGTQQKLAGAKLQLYDSSKKAYGNPVTTDANGQAKWTNLPYGTYYVGEVGAPAGYQVNVNQVQVTINGNNTASFEDSPIIGSVSFVKKQQGTEIPLIGAQYELVTKSGSTYKRAVSAVDGSELPVLTTDKNGKATWNNVVEYGSYYVHEVKAPEGFLLDNTYHAVSVTEHNKIISADVQDPIIIAKIKIAKTDGLTKEPLAGVEFTITRLSGPAALNGAGVGEVAAVIVTDKNGYAETDWLTWGRFKVEETKVPAGYTDSKYSAEIEAYEDGKTYTISVENIPAAGYIRLTKTDADSKKPLKGVQFDIYQGDKLISTMTTDASGVALSGALIKGTYTVKEHNNPEGYIGELTTLTAEVISEKTTDLTADNTPICGKIKILKRDALTKEALAGVVFTITRMTASPASDDADVGKSFTLTTDKNGMAESGWLDYGKFKIEETSVPDHYVNSHFSTEVEINENEKTYVVEVENEPTQGKIQIAKTDKFDGKPISGVVFDIYNGDTKVGSMTTNEKGIAVSGSLPKGNYTVKEKDNPEGYVSDLVSIDCTVKPDETTSLSADNTPIQFRIQVVKTDGLTKTPLPGAVFTITRISGLPSHNGEGDGTVVATLTTDAKGEAVSDLLTWGKYEVKETTVPAHYVDQAFTTTVTGSENNKTYTVTCENEPTKGKIQLTKTDKLDGQPIAGVIFDIYQGNKKVGSMKTNEKGVAVSDPLPKGKYTVNEQANPEGYTADLISMDCEVKSDEVTKLTADNTPIRFKVKIIKTDGLTKQPLAGAVFTITRTSGLPSHNGSGDGEVVATLTTDAKGEATSELLTWGTYEVKETEYPAHYVKNPFSVTVTGTENDKVYEVKAENEPTKGKIQITKTDKLDGQPIAGVVFEIFQGTQKVGSMTTDEKGVSISDPLPKGKYTVKEKDNPEGYIADLVSLDCEVFSDETTKLTADNMPIQFRVKIQKTDGLTKKPLAGAVFTITRISGLPSHNGADNGKVVATLTTDAKGEAVSDLLTWGQYEVTETTVPEHYVDNGFTTTVTGAENNKTYTITCENEPTKGWIRLVKTDSLDKHPISGVQFDILQDGKTISTMTTDANGVAVSEPLHKGLYTVREHENPTGYTAELVSLDCEVFSDQTTELTASNTPIQFRVKIVKNDQLTKEPLAGAEFTITRKTGLPSHDGEEDGKVAAVLVTDEKGEATSELLTWGEYEVTETKVPVHFVDNHFTTTVTGIEDQKTYTISCENEPTKGYIKIVKTDKLDRTPIEGVQFDIYENDEYGSGLAATMTTDKNGIAVSPALRKGKYIVKEHANPTGYTTDLAELDCVVKSDETTNLSCTNTPIQGKIRIIKTDELTKEALAGAEFTITRVSGLPSHKGSNDGEVVAVIVTDANGIAVTPLLTWGVYHVEETGVPVHYVDNHFSADVTIETEDLLTYDVPCENEPTKGWIRLKKTDRINGNPISGVQFDIFYNDQYGEGLAATMITDENGIAMSEPIRKGQYIVKEHGETAGYVFEEVTLNCTVKSDEITDLSATNQPVQVRLKLYKRDADEYAGDPAAIPAVRGDGVLTGAVFQVLAGADILDRQGNVIYYKGDFVIESIKTSGEDASVTTDELWPGVYEIVELTPPVGYQPTDKHTIVDASSAAQQSKEKVITYESVVCNEILYGCYAFVKFTGDNEIHDEAGLIETPEPGAVFKVYLKKAGSFDAARVFEKDTITTDEYGKAATKLLPYGIYTVQQAKAKEGYAIKAPFDIFIRGTESPDNPPSMILNNEAIRYRLKFIKVDAETGKTITLANTAFKLKDANGEYVKQTVHYPRTQEIDTFKTDADGTVTLPETVRYGLYFIEEFTAPEGYLIQTNELAVFVGDENMNQPGEAYLLEFEIEDAPVMGQIRLEKTGLQLIGFKEKEDRYGNTVMQPIYEEKRLAGATFEVHASEDIVGKEGTIWFHADELVDTITTTKERPDLSKILPLGRYYLVEVSAPEGFTFDDRHYEANLIYSDNHTPLVETVVTAGNTFIPSEISLKKEKEVLQLVRDGELIKQTITEAPGEGFVFGLYNDTDIHYEGGTLMADTLVGVGTTDKDGSLTFAGYYPHGRYYIKELSAPVGWKINTDKFMVVLDPHTADEDHVIRATLPETVHDELIWYPVTLTKLDITGEKTLPGALIEVTNDKGAVIYRAYTDQNGQIPNIPVTPGFYHFREVIAPSGYALNEAVMSFTVDEQGGITGETSIRDDYTRILLMKKDENGLPLAGVEFSLVKSNGAVLMRKSSDADGKIVFEEIPFGEYTITESKALAGYQKHEIIIKLSVDGTFVNKEEPLETIINYPIIVTLKKVDQDNKPLPGAEYALINEFGEQTMTAVSDADGMLTFYKVPYGKYTLKELFAPEGYLLSKETPEIIIDDAWQNSDLPALTLTNHLKRLRYIKVDTSGKYLPGVEFSLINASNGEVVEVVKSNERGEFIFTKFDYGFWLIRETKTPDGYCQMKDITFSVDASWTEPAPLTCINIPNYYEFVKTDNEGHPMAGVSFTLEDRDGHILRDLVSGDDGIVHVYDLVPGTYIIREIETWEGYTVSGEVIELVIDEHYIIPDEMYVMVNYPDIQTGVDQEITPMMYAGGAVLLAGLILLVFVLLKKLRGR